MFPKCTLGVAWGLWGYYICILNKCNMQKIPNILNLIKTEETLFPIPFNSFIQELTSTDPNFAKYDPESLLEAFHQELLPTMISEIQNTHEYRISRSWVKSLSLILFTEIYEPDYTDIERNYFLALIETLKYRYPDILHHKNTRISYPSLN